MINTNVEIKIQPVGESYEYSVEKDELLLKYFESGKMRSYISFGSLEEMESVANAMLQAIKFSKE